MNAANTNTKKADRLAEFDALALQFEIACEDALVSPTLVWAMPIDDICKTQPDYVLRAYIALRSSEAGLVAC
jgi:hypothetical protein